MITIHKHEGGSTRCVDRLDPAWLQPDSGVWVWVDLDRATPEEARILSDVFHFHELAIEDALSEKILYKQFKAGEIIVVDTEDDPDKPGDKRLTFTGVEGFQPPSVVELAATGAPEIEPPVSE